MALLTFPATPTSRLIGSGVRGLVFGGLGLGLAACGSITGGGDGDRPRADLPPAGTPAIGSIVPLARRLETLCSCPAQAAAGRR